MSAQCFHCSAPTEETQDPRPPLCEKCRSNDHPTPEKQSHEIEEKAHTTQNKEVDEEYNSALAAFVGAVEFFTAQLDCDISEYTDEDGPDTPRDYFTDDRGWSAETVATKRLGYAHDDEDGWNRNWLTVVLDEDNRVRTLRNAPDLSTARSVIGLDAHPSAPL